MLVARLNQRMAELTAHETAVVITSDAPQMMMGIAAGWLLRVAMNLALDGFLDIAVRDVFMASPAIGLIVLRFILKSSRSE